MQNQTLLQNINLKSTSKIPRLTHQMLEIDSDKISIQNKNQIAHLYPGYIGRMVDYLESITVIFKIICDREIGQHK